MSTVALVNFIISLIAGIVGTVLLLVVAWIVYKIIMFLWKL